MQLIVRIGTGIVTSSRVNMIDCSDSDILALSIYRNDIESLSFGSTDKLLRIITTSSSSDALRA